MLLMASARDLITVFIALELLSIPAYMLAGWRKRDPMGNEAGVKYYLMGVFASAVLLYGMSLLFGDSPATPACRSSARPIAGGAGNTSLWSRSPSSSWWSASPSRCPRSRSTRGRPTSTRARPPPSPPSSPWPSKTAGFVALLQVIFVAFADRGDVVRPLMWVLAAAPR